MPDHTCGKTKLVIEIDCSNAAFEDDPFEEIAIILEELALQGRLDLPLPKKLKDSNGNTCGSTRWEN